MKSEINNTSKTVSSLKNFIQKIARDISEEMIARNCSPLRFKIVGGYGVRKLPAHHRDLLIDCFIFIFGKKYT